MFYGIVDIFHHTILLCNYTREVYRSLQLLLRQNINWKCGAQLELELVEKDVAVTLVMGEGVTRPQDERVRKFAEPLTEKFTCFDTADYDLPGIKSEYRKFLSPVVMNAILQRIGKNMEVITAHSLEIRRYYRKSSY